MKLAFPKPNIRLTKLMMFLLQRNRSIRSFRVSKIIRRSYRCFRKFLTNYNGIVTATIYDKEIERQTLGNDGILEW